MKGHAPTQLSDESRAEHDHYKAQLLARVHAAPVRRVLGIVARGRADYLLNLECGHNTRYFQRRITFRCHDCRREKVAFRFVLALIAIFDERGSHGR